MYRTIAMNLFVVMSLIISGCGKEKPQSADVKPPQEKPQEDHTPLFPNVEMAPDERLDLIKSGAKTLTLKDDSAFLCFHPLHDEAGATRGYQPGCEIWFDYYHDNCFSGGHRYEEAAVVSVATPFDWEQFVLKEGNVTVLNPTYRAISKAQLDSLNTRLYDPLLIEPNVSYAPIKVGRIYFFRYWNEEMKRSFYFKVRVTDYQEKESVAFDWVRLEEHKSDLEPEPDFLNDVTGSLININYGGTVELWANSHQNDYSFRHVRYGHRVKNNEAYYIGADIRFLPQPELLVLERAGQQHNYSVTLGAFPNFDELILTDQGLKWSKSLDEEREDLKQANDILFSRQPRTDRREYDTLKNIGASPIYVIRRTGPNEEDLIVKLQVVSYTKGDRVEIRWERMYPVKLSLLKGNE